MTYSHILGYPRIGSNRETKKALEAYWRGEITLKQLSAVGEQVRRENWQTQAEAGLDFVTVGDFSWYDHVLDTSALLGIVPKRFAHVHDTVDLDTIFCMARGKAPDGREAEACEMTKWFNTNYHYIVPEFTANQNFYIATDTLFTTIQEAQTLGYRSKPVLIGPLTLLWLGKVRNNACNKLHLLEKLIPIYNQIFEQLQLLNVEWLQIDEPILTLDLPEEWRVAFVNAYCQLEFKQLKCLLTTYFGGINDNIDIVKLLPIHGLHIDVCSGFEQLSGVISQIPENCVLSVGAVNGRNIWRADLTHIFQMLSEARAQLHDRLWIASSCSLLHVPVDLDQETELDVELKSWLAFAKQKIAEIVLLSHAIKNGTETVTQQFTDNQRVLQSRTKSSRIHDASLKTKIAALTKQSTERKSPYSERAKSQRTLLGLPLLPTTTIGSFPQTKRIRTIRHEYKAGKIDQEIYNNKIQQEIANVIAKQESLGLDVLVHGEAERNDMVEYFGELLNGFAFTQNGWVQSYGSRCVKPPIIYGDVSRISPMTVDWISYAQSLTDRPVKGMLTGPVTILSWSFPRDDQPIAETALQIALALREEVIDLEKSGIKIIQIDEPAFREALPLRKNDWQAYLDWAVYCFRVASCGVCDHTQIHTHMCYSEFNDVIAAIANLDADVITIECSRSQMELLTAFESYAYPNEIGPGVYDIHSPRVPTPEEITMQLEKALHYIPIDRLWVNPDCGLKTRNWYEAEQSLTNVVAATKLLRAQYGTRKS
jgi:5-methyltetrahydropteroyltriglutamate--homocysteine methyltransferase